MKSTIVFLFLCWIAVANSIDERTTNGNSPQQLPQQLPTDKILPILEAVKTIKDVQPVPQDQKISAVAPGKIVPSTTPVPSTTTTSTTTQISKEKDTTNTGNDSSADETPVPGIGSRLLSATLLRVLTHKDLGNKNN